MNNLTISIIRKNTKFKSFSGGTTILTNKNNEQYYSIKKWEEPTEGKMVWKFNVLKTNTENGIERDITFGSNSYYWIDFNGLHFHFDSLNESLLDETEDAAIWFIANVIDFTCPVATKQSSIFADKLIKTVKNENSDSIENIDIFISWKSLAMVIEHTIMPELNNIKVNINGFSYDILMSNKVINHF